MSLKVVSGIAGSVATIGGGIGIYLLKNNTNNPKPLKPAKSWKDIIASPEYISAKSSGKIFHHIAYKNDEKAEDDAKYFLLEFGKLENSTTTATEQEINDFNFGGAYIFVQKGDDVEGASLELSPGQTIENLNFYCFSDLSVDSAEDLNFNNLKKCKKSDYIELSKKNKKGFLVVDFDNILENQDINIKKAIQNWHNQDMELEVTFFNNSDNESDTDSESDTLVFTSTIKSILHKGFTLPTTNSQ